MKTLKTLAKQLPEPYQSQVLSLKNIDISKSVHLTTDSNAVTPESIFFAIKGVSTDGHRFIKEVEQKKPLLIVYSDEFSISHKSHYLKCQNTRKAYALFCAAFFDNPSKELLTIGITGTSGKTTTTTQIHHLLNQGGIPCGLIGTIQVKYADKEYKATHTTPDPFELQKCLRDMLDNNVRAVVLEVSSHALDQNRVAGVLFDVMGFLNLSPEHLDYHKDMTEYFNAKKRLFTDFAIDSKSARKNPFFVINKNPWGERLITELSQQSNSIPITISSGNTLISTANGITGNYKSVVIQSNMLGTFNAENWVIAIDIALQLGIAADSITKSIQNFPGVRGRLERVPNKKKINILIDYAHKPDALEKVLKTIRLLAPSQKIITVFGCGGDRDKAKRPLMGSISEASSDWIILTNDNPRSENPEQILNEIQLGMSGSKPCDRIPDRKKAIKRAIELAKEGDFVLIAGKGHETEQVVGKNKILFDDREVTLQLLDE